MKKFTCGSELGILWLKTKTQFWFKTTFLVILILFLNVGFNPILAQKVTLNEVNVSLRAVLEKLCSEAKVDLIGEVAQLEGAAPVTINVKNKELKEVLAQISKNQPVHFELRNNTIIVKVETGKKNERKSTALSTSQEHYLLQGYVINLEGKPLTGVTVRLPGVKEKRYVTANDGSFELRVSGDEILEFSMLGYELQSINVGNRSRFTVQMRYKNNQIDEVTVSTGYSVRAKESMTGASTTITRKELEKFNNNNIFSIIQSIDPAFKIDIDPSMGSNPNVIPDITVRGTNSVGEYAVNSPLVILDGFEVPLERLYDLDVNRIERISLLKDASTTVLYGSRGGNGVLVVETRLPKGGKFTVTYDLKPSVTLVDLSDYNLMNAQQKLDYERLAGVYTAKASTPANENRQQTDLDNLYTSNRSKILGGTDTYWLSQPVETSISIGHNIRIEGGEQNVRYSIDANYNDFKGAMKASGRKRSGAGFNLIYRIPQKITFRNNASFQSTKAYNSPYGSFAKYALMNPYQPLHDEMGQPIIQYLNEFEDQVRFNPIYDATLPFRDINTTTVLTDNFSVEWFIIPELILSSRAVLEKTFINAEAYRSPFSSTFLNREAKEKGSYRISNGQGLSYQANLQMTFAKVFNAHAINASLIGEMNSSDKYNTGHVLTGFTNDDFISPSQALQYAINSKPSYSNAPSRIVGVVATGNYTYDQKYIVDLSYRMDGSSKFGRNNRFGNFWSTGLGYNLHKESFFENDFMDELRLFVNSGVNGTNDFNANMTATSYTIAPENIYFKEIGLAYNNDGNASLRWPKIKSTSFGFNGRMWNGRIAFSFSAYNKVTDRMVSLITVAPSLGIAKNSYFENMGKTQNRGIESSLSLRVYENQSRTFNWYLSTSALKNRGKLLEISDALRQLNENNLKLNERNEYIQTVYYRQGESLNNIKGVRSLGIDPANGRELFLKSDGSRTYDWDAKDITIIGVTEPDIFGTINTTLSYRSLSVQAYFNYTLGGDLYNQTLLDKIENVNPRMNADVRVLEQRWKQPGDVSYFKAIEDNTKTQLTSRFVQKENYLRFSAVNINYDLPNNIVRKYKMERLRFNFAMNDIFRWSNVSMERGTDYPFARTFNFGLMAQF